MAFRLEAWQVENSDDRGLKKLTVNQPWAIASKDFSYQLEQSSVGLWFCIRCALAMLCYV